MTHTAVAHAPEAVQRLAASAREFVTKALNFELDGTDATLPVLDHYLSEVPREPLEIAELVTAAVGCYFGEILRERFGGAWILEDEAPAAWRLELADGMVTLVPMAVAYQAIAHGDDSGYDDTVAVAPAYRVAVIDALEGLAKVEPAVYYSLASRYDTLETVVDVLAGILAQESAPTEDEQPSEDDQP